MLRRVMAALVALAATGAIVALSRAPYSTGQGDAALLRVSWSGRPERIERCRELSAAELAERPAHMRQRLECEGHAARYAIAVTTDGVVRSLDTVTGGGLRGDRAIHMLQEYGLAAGEHAIGVSIARLDSVTTPDDASDDAEVEEDEGPIPPGAAPLPRARRERDERRRQRQGLLPAALSLDTVLRVPAGGVVLVTYDPEGRRLAAMTGSGR